MLAAVQPPVKTHSRDSAVVIKKSGDRAAAAAAAAQSEEAAAPRPTQLIVITLTALIFLSPPERQLLAERGGRGIRETHAIFTEHTHTHTLRRTYRAAARLRCVLSCPSKLRKKNNKLPFTCTQSCTYGSARVTVSTEISQYGAPA